MERSPTTIKEWQHKGSLKNAIAELTSIRNANAMTACWAILNSEPTLPVVKRYARIALAANNGVTRLLLKQIEGR